MGYYDLVLFFVILIIINYVIVIKVEEDNLEIL